MHLAFDAMLLYTATQRWGRISWQEHVYPINALVADALDAGWKGKVNLAPLRVLALPLG